MKKAFYTFSLLSIFLLVACKQEKPQLIAQNAAPQITKKTPPTKQFNDYWYAGTAELNSYDLQQSRYGELRQGEVVLVFVTEPFSLSKQVKLDNGAAADADKVPVMKLNQIRKFNTGIYDYSVMTSTFTPVDTNQYPNTLKLNTSMQEWCGHTFTQLNLKGNNYQFKEFSYFESEGDSDKTIPVAMLEEELMTRIRLNKGQLPEGKINLIFSSLYSRFAHNEMNVSEATITTLEKDTSINYNIAYINVNRTLTIAVQKEFPYKILSWTEDNGDGLLTTATLKKTLNEPYWNQKRLADDAMREKLGLQN